MGQLTNTRVFVMGRLEQRRRNRLVNTLAPAANVNAHATRFVGLAFILGKAPNVMVNAAFHRAQTGR
jgi:hypothetical protein